ncbi:hypothetical protein [Blastococcus saxobsidens]|uniref:Uncharacterized protein n=1 Tax=Blastococcus saxobsidens (strain DD2) TaxID=1146883 RepID=H6RR01_BLASD|nr:hypothetical protein [Blastococcus saxobsidens]CCG02880.1 membrane protein of unknown function [Blastococcus saxobsidens DD2]
MRVAGERIELRAAALVAVLLAGAVLALTVDLPSGAQVRTWLDGRGPEGWLLLVAVLAVVLVAPVPRSVLSVLGGVVPSTVVQVGIGASAGFVVARVDALVAVPVVVLAVLALGAGGACWYRPRAAAGGAA